MSGAYPFERPEDKHDAQKLAKMIQVCYKFSKMIRNELQSTYKALQLLCGKHASLRSYRLQSQLAQGLPGHSVCTCQSIFVNC